MRTTNKLVIGAAVLVAAYAGTAWYMGKKAETEITHQVTEMNAAIATYLATNLPDSTTTINILSYDRSWFSSKVNYELLIKDNEKSYQFLLEDHLRHGPLPISALFKGHVAPVLAYSTLTLLPSEHAQPWFDATNGKVPLTAHSFIGFSGSVDSQIDFAAIQYKDEQGSELVMAAAQANLDYSKDTDSLQVDTYLPSLVLNEESNQTKVQITDSRFKGDVTGLKQSELSAGEMSIAHLAINVQGSPQIVVENIQANSTYQLINNLVDSSLHYDLGKISVDQQDLGGAQLDLAVKRLDYALLSRLSQTENVEELSQEQVLPIVRELLAHKPEISMDKLNFSNQVGNSSLKVDLRLAPTAAEEKSTEGLDLAHYVELLEVDLQISRKMLQGYFKEESLVSGLVDMMFNKMAEQGKEVGLFAYDGDVAEMDLSFNAAEQTLMLNGKPATEEELVYILLAIQMGGGLF